MSLTVLKPGFLTTLQDRGRYGYAALGVGHAGPMDGVAHRLANALVGNDEDAAALEITVLGPRLRFDADTIIALTGAPFDACLDGVPVAPWQRLPVTAGAVLDCGRARCGQRLSLAVAGGLRCKPLLGSRATDLNAGFGAPLQQGDSLLFVASSAPRARWSLDPRPWFDVDPSQPLRLIRGHHFGALDGPSRAALYGTRFRIGAASNRVGYRLDGARLALERPLELASEPCAFGTVQLPTGGQPIVLMAEHPVTGGYPRIGQVAAIDLPRLAQRGPGDPLHFVEIDLDEAQNRYLERERELSRLQQAIAARLP